MLGRVIVAAIVLLGLLGWATLPAQAADAPGLSAAVKAGFQGNYRNAEWYGVQVTLSNDSDADYSGTLSLSGRGRLHPTSLDLALAGHSRKQVWLYAFSADYSGDLQLTLRQGASVLLQRNVSLSFNDSSVFLLAAVSSDSGALSGLSSATLGNLSGGGAAGNPGIISNSGSQGHAVVAHIGLDELPPAPAALDGLDALVIVDGDSSRLSAAQVAAIRAWVIGGGDLVIGGGQAAASNAAAFADILPVRVGVLQSLGDLSPLARFAGSSEPITLTGQVVASGATLQPNARLLAANPDGTPLLAQRDYGRGRVSWLGVDPNLGELRAWGSYAQLWQNLLTAHNGGPTFTALNMTRFGAGSSLLPQLDLPDPALLLIVLLVYIAVVGPLNYLLLRQLGRRELAWLTTPLITLLFAAIFYGIGYQSKGGDVLVSRSAVVFASGSDDSAIVAGTVGIFSPRRDSYSLALSDTTLAGDTGDFGNVSLLGGNSPPPATLRLGAPNTLTDLAIANWQQGEVAVQDSIKLAPQFSATVQVVTPTVKVTVKNLATQPYTDVVLYAPSVQQVSAAFSLAAGESKQIDLSKKYGDLNQLSSDLSGGQGSSAYYISGSGGGIYFTNNQRGRISETQRQQQVRDQLAELAVNSREAGLGSALDSNQALSGSNAPLPPSKDPQIYIAAWSNANYLPATLTIAAQERQSVGLYVAPLAELK